LRSATPWRARREAVMLLNPGPGQALRSRADQSTPPLTGAGRHARETRDPVIEKNDVRDLLSGA
jgi:hypothetical protein